MIKMYSERELDELLKTYSSPLYIYDEDAIRDNAIIFMKTFKSYIPNFKQYFAVKATPNKHIMQILSDIGMGFDCSSLQELSLAESIKSTDIMYTSNYTGVEEYETLLKRNPIINLDDIDCFHNLCDASIRSKTPLPDIIGFRLNPDFGATDSDVVSNILAGSGTKFGIPSHKIVDAYREALEKGIKRFGMHVMTGSCILEIDYFRELIDVIYHHIDMIHKELGICFEYIDLGGGIGIPYKPEQLSIDIDLLAKTIAKQIKFNKDKYGLAFDSMICMENGRYITGPYGYLISRCKSIKIGYNDKKFYGLDACMSNLMRPGMYGAYHKITVPRLVDETVHYEKVNIVGSLCENNDWFAKNREMPLGIIKEDIFMIHDAGAHGHSMGFQYNGKLRSAEVLVSHKNHTVKLIREKETFS
jgi:diaminopimelate decarboxylase